MSSWLIVLAGSLGSFAGTQWVRGVLGVWVPRLPSVLKALIALAWAVIIVIILNDPLPSGRILAGEIIVADGFAWVLYEVVACFQAVKDKNRQETLLLSRNLTKPRL